MLKKKFNPGVSGAAVLTLCGFILLYRQRLISPAEAKTLFFANQYFLFSAMLPSFDFDMPLYYVLAHFAAFSKEALNILRMFSSMCAAASLFLIYRFFLPLPSVKEENRDISFTGFSIVCALSLIALSVSGISRATPDIFVFTSVMFSFVCFTRAFVGGSQSAIKLYLPATIVALYSAPVSFCILPAQLFFLKKFRAETSNAGSAAVKRAALMFIPGILIFAISLLKAVPSAAPGNTLFYVFHSVFLDNSICFSLIGMSVAFAVPRKKSSGIKGHLAAIIVVAISSALVFAPYFPTHGWKFRETRTYITNTEFTLSNNSPVVILFPAGNDGYYYSALGEKKGVDVHIITPAALNNQSLDLGNKISTAPSVDEMGKLKELFLLSDSIRVIDFSFMPTSGQAEKEFATNLIRWGLSVANSSCSDSNQVSVCAFTLPGSHTKDGILLDLFINHYADYESAVKLITDNTFEISALTSYFNGNPGNVSAAVEKLMNSCGENSMCRSMVAKKIIQYSTISENSSIRSAVEKYISKKTGGEQ